MLKLELIICKLVGKILKLLGRGSNYPGVLALKMNKNMPYIKRGTPVLDGHLDDLYLDSHCVDEPPMEHLYYALKDDETAERIKASVFAK